MTAAQKLLDKAATHCTPANYVGLAARTGLTTSVLSGWKLGRYPMPQERIAEVARIARVDAGEWMVLVEADQLQGEAKKAYGTLVKRLGIAALLALVVVPVLASDFAVIPTLSIMFTLVALTILRSRNLNGWSSPNSTPNQRHDYLLAL